MSNINITINGASPDQVAALVGVGRFEDGNYKAPYSALESILALVRTASECPEGADLPAWVEKLVRMAQESAVSLDEFNAICAAAGYTCDADIIDVAGLVEHIQGLAGSTDMDDAVRDLDGMLTAIAELTEFEGNPGGLVGHLRQMQEKSVGLAAELSAKLNEQGEELKAIAQAVGFDGPHSGLVAYVRDQWTWARNRGRVLEGENVSLTQEVKRLADVVSGVGTDDGLTADARRKLREGLADLARHFGLQDVPMLDVPAAVVALGPAPGVAACSVSAGAPDETAASSPGETRAPLERSARVWLGDVEHIVSSHRLEEDGSYSYLLTPAANHAGLPVWATEGDPDFSTEAPKPKRRRRSKAEIEAEKAAAEAEFKQAEDAFRASLAEQQDAAELTQEEVHQAAAHQGPLEAGKYQPNPAAPIEVQEAGRALAELAEMPEATLTPGEAVVVFYELGLVEASIIRGFEGTDRYEVQILREGAGKAVVGAEHIRKAPRPQPITIVAQEGVTEEVLQLLPEHEFADEPVTDGAGDDPLVTNEQREEVQAAYKRLGLTMAEAKNKMLEHFNVGYSDELRVSQARQLVDVIFPEYAALVAQVDAF